MSALPGSVVSDIEAACALIGHGVEGSEVFHYAAIRGTTCAGRDPEGRSYRPWASLSHPDGIGWLLQVGRKEKR
jgi:hypothetical protein